MKSFKTKSVLSVFVTIQTNITIIKISTINVINIEKNAPKFPLYNLKTLKLSPAVCCDICKRWVRIGCNNICKKTYSNLKKIQLHVSANVVCKKRSLFLT